MSLVHYDHDPVSYKRLGLFFSNRYPVAQDVAKVDDKMPEAVFGRILASNYKNPQLRFLPRAQSIKIVLS